MGEGESLSPILFSFYMNDLYRYLDEKCNNVPVVDYECDQVTYYLRTFLLMYADDTILLSESKKGLQELLNAYTCYCNIVDVDLLLAHVDVADGNTQAQDLLKLELDGGLDAVHLGLEGLAVSHEGGELTGLVQTGSQQTRNLLDDRLGGQETVVLLRELLHELLVLLELLQGVHVHGVEADGLGLVHVLGVGQDAELHPRSGREGKLDGTAETLVLLRVVVLQTNLKLDGLGKLSVLFLALREHVRDVLAKHISVQFGRHDVSLVINQDLR